jgi:hypothetical protein
VEAVIVPPQSSAPLDSAGLFIRDWYLFFHAAQSAASSGNGIAQYGTGSARKLLDTQGLPDGALWAETDTGLVYQWHGSSLQWIWILGTLRASYKLTTATFAIPVPTAAAAPGVKLAVALMQDATGGRAITFASGFAFASVGLGNALANTASFLEFTLFNVADLAALGITSTKALWVMTSQPLTDMTQ